MRYWTFLLLGFFIAVPAYSEERWTVFAGTANLEEYQTYVDKHNPFEAEHISSEDLWRHSMEYVVLRHALLMSDCDCDIDFVPYEVEVSHIRMLDEVESGRAITTPAAAFDIDPRIEGNFLLSDPILAGEDFYVGLYTHEDREDILALTDPEEISKLKFAVGETWAVDQQVLSQLGVEIVPAETWSSLIKFLHTGRADVVLQPFSSKEDMSFLDTDSGLVFKPILGFKINFPAGRVYPISKAHPDGERFRAYLNQGIQRLKENGKLDEYLVQSGVVDPRIDSFQPLIFNE